MTDKKTDGESKKKSELDELKDRVDALEKFVARAFQLQQQGVDKMATVFIGEDGRIVVKELPGPKDKE